MKNFPNLKIDLKGCITYISDGSLIELENANLHDILGKELIHFISDPSARSHFQSMWPRLIKGEFPHISFFSGCHGLKTKRSFFFKIFSPSGDQTEIDCLVQTLDEEERFNLDQKHLEQIANNIGAVLWIAGPDREIYYINSSFEKFYEISIEDHLRDPSLFMSRVHPEDRDLFKGRMSFIDENHRHIVGTINKNGIYFRYLLNDGSWRHVDSIRCPIYDAEGNVTRIIGMTIDNTKLYTAQSSLTKQQKELSRAHEQLKETNNLLEEFIAFSCHDLLQPLRTMNGYLSIIERDHFQTMNPACQCFFLSIRDILEYMNKLVEGIGNIALIDSAKKPRKMINMMELMEKHVEPIFNTSMRSVCLIKKRQLAPVYGNEEQVMTLFQNIIDNAIKYSKDFPRIKISSKSFEDFTIYSIQDKGIGIEKSKHNDIFKFGLRLHSLPNRSGVGLGLASCKKIMTSYGGKIWVDSKKGVGSTFYLMFPTHPSINDQGLCRKTEMDFKSKKKVRTYDKRKKNKGDDD